MKPVFCHEIDAYAIALLDRITLMPRTRNYRPSVATKDSDRCLVLIQPSKSPRSAPHRVRPIFASVSPQRAGLWRDLRAERDRLLCRSSAERATRPFPRQSTGPDGQKGAGHRPFRAAASMAYARGAIMPVKPGSFRPSAGTGRRGRDAPKAPRIETLAKKTGMSLKRSVIRPRV